MANVSKLVYLHSVGYITIYIIVGNYLQVAITASKELIFWNTHTLEESLMQ